MGRILRTAGVSLRMLGSVIIVASMARPAAAQKTDTAAPAVPGVTVLQGVFSDRQAQYGEGVYQSNCTSCHALETHVGPRFELTWSGRTIYDYFQLIRSTMPQDDPGRLSRGDYIAIVAFLLKSNGFPAAADSLPNDDERLKQIRIEAKRPSTSSPAPASSKP